MIQKDFWNDKFKEDDFLYGLNPNEFLLSKESLLKKGANILLLGEGEGRNALFFAKKGFKVTAIDSSNIGLEKLQKKAKEENLKIDTLCLDLNSWINVKKYDVIMISYLHLHKNDLESLFKKIEDSLEENGYFIAEFFSKNQLNYSSGGPKDIDLLYCIEDFENRFLFCKKEIKEEIVKLDEGVGHQGLASVIRVVIQKES